ncbi:MAG: PEP/pyruvate-binding domain-containing protein [Cyanobacteriota bacterium]
MPFILFPTDPHLPPEQLGGKARSLYELQHSATGAFPIPDWFVVSPEAFTAGQGVALTEAVKAELAGAIARLCPAGECVAVRSSAVEEDGATLSFAGQLESFLFVPPEQVGDRTVQVWRSAMGDRLLAYRQEHGLTEPPPPPAVLVQRMVNAEVAGVAFSANPITHQRSVAVVSAVRGVGEALVSGESDADTWTVNREGDITSAQLQDPANPVLTPAQVRDIAQLARRAERHFARPQDIEWAIAQGQLYLLQSRPITTLRGQPDPDDRLVIWDNSNIAESYGGITTPLTFSFARRAYEAVYREFCRMMGVSETAILQHDNTFRCMLGLVQGRIYYNLLNWYRVLALLPGFRVNRRFMEQMMGVKEELPADVLATLQQATAQDKFRDSLRLIKTLLGLVKNYLTLPGQIHRFYARLDHALSLPAESLDTLRAEELVAHYHDLERQLLTRWDAPLVNDFFAMIFYGVLRKLTAAWCHDTAGTLQNDLISGEGGMISAEPARRIQHMAHTAAQSPALVALLQTGSLSEIRAKLAAFPAFQAQYEDYLAKFGDRCLEELKLESPTLQDDPLMLLRSVGSLAAVRGQEAVATEPAVSPAQPSLRHRAEAHVHQSLKSSPLKRLLFNWVLGNARSRVRDRENLRFERTRVFGRVRRIVVELGRRFYAEGWLDDPRDVFYLELDELFGKLDGTATCHDLNALARLRRAEFDRFHQEPAPGDRLQIPPNPNFSAPSLQPTDSPTLHGLGCCPGIVRAPVQVITDPKTAVLIPGSILVAERTDPGWIMLFPAAAGVLVERGSLLSHAAIVAREMGIPAIVSIPGVTTALKTGDWVEMDGSAGTILRVSAVEVLQEGANAC